MTDQFTDPVDPRLARLAFRGQDRMPDVPDADPAAVARRAGLVRDADARIRELERQIQLLLATTKVPYPHGVMADGTEVPDASHPYGDPSLYPVTLLLASGEQVGAPNFQSSHHYSPKLGRDVPVEGYLSNAQPAAA